MREKNNLSRGKIPAPPPTGYQMVRPLFELSAIFFLLDQRAISVVKSVPHQVKYDFQVNWCIFIHSIVLESFVMEQLEHIII